MLASFINATALVHVGLHLCEGLVQILPFSLYSPLFA